jgi:hypothetical protein
MATRKRSRRRTTRRTVVQVNGGFDASDGDDLIALTLDVGAAGPVAVDFRDASDVDDEVLVRLALRLSCTEVQVTLAGIARHRQRLVRYMVRHDRQAHLLDS